MSESVKLVQIRNRGKVDSSGKSLEYLFIDHEAYKKCRTSAITKALSMLGSGADIFQGKFDDSKYVNALIENENAQDTAETEELAKLLETADAVVGRKEVNKLLALKGHAKWPPPLDVMQELMEELPENAVEPPVNTPPTKTPPAKKAKTQESPAKKANSDF